MKLVLALACAWISGVDTLAAQTIRLKTRTLKAGELRTGAVRRIRTGSSHYLVDFGRPVTPELLAGLRARGAVITGYVSPATVMVAARDGLRLGETVRMGRMLSADKISPVLAEETAPAYVVEFHSDVAPEDARRLVRDLGLEVLENPDLLPDQLLVAGSWDAVQALAEFDEVAYVFPAAADLVAGNPLMACPGPLTEAGAVGQYVMVGQGWGSGGVHYFFNNTPGLLPAATAQSEMVRALSEWARFAPIDFSAASGPLQERTIAVLFAKGEHGDGYPFDGPGKVLAHTFYPVPVNREPLAGDMHLDAAENWQTGGTGVDLYSVALHEAGHALGLGHSDRPDSVMYPYYRQAAGLTADDIAGIRALYGTRDSGSTPPSNPQPQTPSTPATPAALAIVVAAPAAGTATTAISIAASGQVSGGSGTAVVSWRTDRGASGTGSGSGNWTVASIPLLTGSNLLTFTARDGAGATASASVTVTRQAAQPQNPGTPPALRITSPALTIVATSLASITLRGTASAAAGQIASVAWNNSTGSAGSATGTADWSAVVPLRVGSNTVTMRAYDTWGNSAWRSISVVRR